MAKKKFKGKSLPENVYKYQEKFDEMEQVNEGKFYFQYIAAENKRLAPTREKRRKKAMKEKKERDRLKRLGILPEIGSDDFTAPVQFGAQLHPALQ
jgi:hypothetical protein